MENGVLLIEMKMIGRGLLGVEDGEDDVLSGKYVELEVFLKMEDWRVVYV